jgi:hypothetical protein
MSCDCKSHWALIIKQIFVNFFRTICEIGGQMSWDRCLAESLYHSSPSLAEHKKPTTYDVGNPSLDLEQAHKCGCIKPFNVS